VYLGDSYSSLSSPFLLLSLREITYVKRIFFFSLTTPLTPYLLQIPLESVGSRAQTPLPSVPRGANRLFRKASFSSLFVFTDHKPVFSHLSSPPGGVGLEQDFSFCESFLSSFLLPSPLVLFCFLSNPHPDVLYQFRVFSGRISVEMHEILFHR